MYPQLTGAQGKGQAAIKRAALKERGRVKFLKRKRAETELGRHIQNMLDVPASLANKTISRRARKCWVSLSRRGSRIDDHWRLRIVLQSLHNALDQFLSVGEILHHHLNVHDRFAWPALALAVDAMLADESHSVGDHVHGHGQPSSGNPHHGLVMLQFSVLFVENSHE
jgi:hypothetical protein